MGDDNTNKQQSLIAQLEGEIDKSERDGHKAKLKDMIKRKRDAEKVVAGIDREILKYLEDNGIQA